MLKWYLHKEYFLLCSIACGGWYSYTFLLFLVKKSYRYKTEKTVQNTGMGTR